MAGRGRGSARRPIGAAPGVGNGDVEGMEHAAVVGRVVVGVARREAPFRESGDGAVEDLAGALAGLLQGGRNGGGAGVAVHGAVERAGGAEGDRVPGAYGDGAAVGVAGVGALGPALGARDEGAGLGEDVEGGRRGVGHGHDSWVWGAGRGEAAPRARSNMATTCAWLSCSLRPM